MPSKFFHGSPVLMGDSTVPGVGLSKELKKYIPVILKACKDYGLDFYPTVVQICTYDEISEIAAYGGFPCRIPHWSFGSEYEDLQHGYENGMYKIYEMVINCLIGSTRVPTMRGTVPVSEVVVGDTVYAGNGTRNVVAVTKQPRSKTLVIKRKHQSNDLICTPNHKWMVLTDKGPAWVEASDLKAGDVLIGGDIWEYYQKSPAKLNWSADAVIEATRPNIRHRIKNIRTPEYLTLDLAELLGIITGDGTQGGKSRENMVSVAVDKAYKDYAVRVAGLFDTCFGLKVLWEDKGPVWQITVCSKALVDFIDYLGMRKGCTYKTKRVPWVIWQSSCEYRAAYLRGLFDTDGCSADHVGFNAYNHDLVSDVQSLLSEMGIYSKTARVSNNHNNISQLLIQGRESVFKFKDRIGFSIDYKSAWLDELTDTANCVGGGVHLAYYQKLALDIGKKCKIKTASSLGGSMYNMKKSKVGLNAIYGFVFRALQAGYSDFAPLWQALKVPHYEVMSVEAGPETETYDIALDHDDHDFMANGVLSHNTNPSIIYCLASNTLLDHLTVVAHATGHNDFFKNNIHFSATDTNMVNKMANHATRVRKYMTRWGRERVIEFIDHVMRIETLVDGAKAWDQRQIKDRTLADSKTYHHPRRLKVDGERLYMDPYINTPDFKKSENERVAEIEASEDLGLFKEPTRDIMGYIKNNAPLKPWQADIVSMLYEEAMYFWPQRQTKVCNEMWASFIDYEIMARQGYVSLGQKGDDCGIVDYSIHKSGVLGGKYSTNPYKLGFSIMLDIEERWNKGQFGPEWDDCKDMRVKENWDTKANLGKEKVFEVRKYYNDLMLIDEFFTEDFCRKMEFFHWKHFPNGEYRLDSRDYKKIKANLIRRHANGGLPDIRLVEPNYRGRGYMLLQHYDDGRTIHDPYAREVLASLRTLWGNDVFLATRNRSGDEIVYGCRTNDADDVTVVDRKKHQRELG